MKRYLRPSGFIELEKALKEPSDSSFRDVLNSTLKNDSEDIAFDRWVGYCEANAARDLDMAYFSYEALYEVVERGPDSGYSREHAESIDALNHALQKYKARRALIEFFRESLRRALFDGSIDSIIIKIDGKQERVPSEIWARENADQIFDHACVQYVEGSGWDARVYNLPVFLEEQSYLTWLKSLEPPDVRFELGMGYLVQEADEADSNIRRPPGRPSKMKQILPEFERRMAAGLVKGPHRIDEARELAEWARQQGLSPPDDGYISRQIKKKYEKYWAEKGRQGAKTA